MRRETQRHHDQVVDGQTFGEWLMERQHFSPKRQLGSLATMLALVMVGPRGALVQSLHGG